MNYEEYNFSKKEEIILFICFLVACAFFSLLFYNSPLLGICGLTFFFKFKKFVKSYLIDKRKIELRNEFKDCMLSFSTSFLSGRHMYEAISEAITGLPKIYGSDALMARELKEMLKKIQNSKYDDARIWTDFAERSGLEEVEEFAETFKILKSTGGNLPFAVQRGAMVISDKIAIESELKTLLAQKKSEGMVIGMMPIFIIIFLRLVSFEYFKVMYTEPGGRIIMTAVMAIELLSLYFIRKIIDINV